MHVGHDFYLAPNVFATGLCGVSHAASTLPLQQLSKQPLRFQMEGPLFIGPDKLESLHWASQEEFGVLMSLSGGGICVILVNSWPLTLQALPSSSFFFFLSLLLVSAVCTLCWTTWTNNLQTSLLIHWSIMPFVSLFGSKGRLMLSTFLIYAVIFELGKWLFTCWAVLWTCIPRSTKKGSFLLI